MVFYILNFISLCNILIHDAKFNKATRLFTGEMIYKFMYKILKML